MLALAALGCCPLLASGEGFLGGHALAARPVLDHEAHSHQLQAAMGTMLGCGPQEGRATLEDVERLILPIWRALPRTAHERVEWRWVRYTAHRYFMKRSSVMIRGFEPVRQVNASYAGEAEILRHQAPALVDMVLDGHRSSTGFSLQDIVQLVATLEQLVFNSESDLLEKVYAENRAEPGRSLDDSKLREVLENYMVHWIMGDDEEGIREALKDRKLLIDMIPHWASIGALVQGTVKTVQFQQQHAPLRAHHGRAAMSPAYSFQDAHQAVGSIGRSFASFWETTCQDIKTSLVEMDNEGTGRVRLSDFYGANGNGEWRFGESEAYLRELGALDESSSMRGAQVIIPNYLQAASNCIVSREHYLVCCANECEDILGEVEAAVGAPLAQPTEIFWIVGNLTSYDDYAAPITEELAGQLQRIASSHGGKVPLHGRLFAQWLHYVFPRECPFPHVGGTATAMTPSQFGQGYIATDAEMKQHAENASGVPAEEDLEWMSQWTQEEELLASYGGVQLRAPWERSSVGTFTTLLFVAGVLVGGVSFGRSKGGSDPFALPLHSKSHFV